MCRVSLIEGMTRPALRVRRSALALLRASLGQGLPLHRIGHPRDDACRARARRRQPRRRAFPDFPASATKSRRPRSCRRGRHQSVRRDVGIVAAARSDRRPHAAALRRRHRRRRQVTVCCGSTEAMISTLATLNPGDEVIVFEPYYENYGPDAILSGATPRYVPLHQPDWSIDAVNCAPRLRRRRRRSSSTRRTTRPARCSPATNCARRRALSGARSRSRSPTRSTSSSSTARPVTCHCARSRAWRIGPSRSAACRSPSASPAGASCWAIAPPHLAGSDSQGARLPHRRCTRAIAGGAPRSP